MLIRRIIWLLLLAGLAPACGARVAPVHVLRVQGQIDPAVAGYVREGVAEAQEDGAQAVLIVMDTPGGLLESTRDIIKDFFASRVPVIVYVSPNGAWAASAGAFITMAADIAAMAPVSNIGSSSPVGIGGGAEPDETSKKKAFNAVARYARSVAERRGRNAEWAEKAVREADNLTAEQALEQDVIDYVSPSISDLLDRVDGRRVKLDSGPSVTLRTVDAPLQERPMSPWETFLHYLSNPMIALFLTLGAMYGIIYELSNPGSVFPGVIGAICLILLLYSYSVIPVNAAGFALLGLAVAFFVAEFFVAGTGILAAGGIVSFFLGLMMLFRSHEGFLVPIWLLAVVTLLSAGFFLVVAAVGLRALRNPYVSGGEGMVGRLGEARTDLDPAGQIFVDGALWRATSESGPIAKGERVEVLRMEGLKLTVRRADEPAAEFPTRKD